jgi:cytochrome c oxidase assembly protein Cox11
MVFNQMINVLPIAFKLHDFFKVSSYPFFCKNFTINTTTNHHTQSSDNNNKKIKITFSV